MYLTAKMKLNVGIVLPFRIEEPFTLREVYQVAILILRDISLLIAGKIFQFLWVLAR